MLPVAERRGEVRGETRSPAPVAAASLGSRTDWLRRGESSFPDSSQPADKVIEEGDDATFCTEARRRVGSEAGDGVDVEADDEDEDECEAGSDTETDLREAEGEEPICALSSSRRRRRSSSRLR
jgi:hypothetical protein